MTASQLPVRAVLVALGVAIVLPPAVLGREENSPTELPSLRATQSSGLWTVSLDGQVLRQTDQPVDGLRSLSLNADGGWVALWQENARPWYAISLDGRGVRAVRATSYALLLRYATFDPLAQVPAVSGELRSRPESRLRIVQFVTQPLDEYRAGVTALGAELHHYLGEHAYLAMMDELVAGQVATLPFVRWVGEFHPAYRLNEDVRRQIESGDLHLPRRFVIQAVRPGGEDAGLIARRASELGGRVDVLNPDGFLVEVTVTGAQLLELAHLDAVLFIDPVLPTVSYLNNVRIVGGANYIEQMGGFKGTGVRAEVMDSGLYTAHGDFQHHPPLIRSNGGSTSHGTSVFGIVFGDGKGDPSARGLMPDAQGIFAVYTFNDRRGHLQGLTSDPYYGVFQTNSWGQCCTTLYGNYAAEIDDIIFNNDLVFLQAQANTGNQSSDVSAWAKNIISVGGIRHYDTADRGDDKHLGMAGSTGPAIDGRIKPDLSFWYDSIRTTANTGGYTSSFGGTSAATPTTAGHVGLFFQMWSKGIFGNPVDPNGTVFSNRPKSTLAKAFMINSALAYPFVGESHDLRRVRQGWGLADVKRIYEQRSSVFWVNETDVLKNLEKKTYQLTVEPNTPELRVTMVYMDPAGVPNSQRHRVNDLTLKVTAPGGSPYYYGNNGLLAGNQSTPGGNPNVVDTVENVWVPAPAPGVWVVEVSADELVKDARPESEGVIDADFALVATGVRAWRRGDMNCDGNVDFGDINPFVLALSDPDEYRRQHPNCNINNGDVNGDGSIDFGDINPFVDLLSR